MTGLGLALLGSAVALAASAPASAQPEAGAPGGCEASADRAACAHIVAVEQQLTRMLVSGDSKPVEENFADDGVWTVGDGRTRTKAQMIAAIRSGPRMATSALVRADVRIYGEVAVVCWTETWTDATHTSPPARTFGTDTWLKRAGRWQIIASQEAHTS